MNKKNVVKKPFGKTAGGREIFAYSLKNRNGLQLTILNYGGIISSLKVPDKQGNPVDIVLGFDSLQPYLENHPYLGAIIGRYANRIANGLFSLNGKDFHLARNNGNNHLHGGLRGFDKVAWEMEPLENYGESGIKMKYTSKDREEGYPGNLQVTVKYTLTNQNELKMVYSATTDNPTHVNLTCHSYFNLNGAGSGDILGHELMIDADFYIPVNRELIPNGALSPVKNTPLDFRSPKGIGEQISQVKGGYDHNFVLNKNHPPEVPAATAYSEKTGIRMDIFTSEPGIQFYTGNFLDGSLKGKGKIPYQKHYGFCLETQHFPDSPNQPGFPTTRLDPFEEYNQITTYRISSA